MNTEQLIQQAKKMIADNQTPESVAKKLYTKHKPTANDLATALKVAMTETTSNKKQSQRKKKGKSRAFAVEAEGQGNNETVEDATYLASLLVASIPGVTPLDVANALKDPRNYPSLTAFQLGEVLMDEDVFPDITAEQMLATLTEVTCSDVPCYTTQQVTEAIEQLYPNNEPTTYNRTPVSGSNGQMPFDDTALADGRRIVKLVVHHGNIIDGFKVYYDNPDQASDQHGGNGGRVTEIVIPVDDVLAEVAGYWGTWFGANYILQITLKTRKGQVYGPFGDMAYANSRNYFLLEVNDNNTEQIVAFFGSATYGDNGRATLLGSIGAVIRKN